MGTMDPRSRVASAMVGCRFVSAIVLDGELTGDNRGGMTVPFFDDLKEVSSCRSVIGARPR